MIICMNPFILEKIGEVLALARVGSDTCIKGKAAFEKILDTEEVSTLHESFIQLEKDILIFEFDTDERTVIDNSAKEAEIKITSMRDTYVDGQWDAEDEVLEWMGFYTGAALVHWELLAGTADAIVHVELQELSYSALDLYQDIFVSDEEFLREIGSARST